MAKIQFKKNYKGTEKITDVPNGIYIEHDYFGFNDDNYPSESNQFRTLIAQNKISLVKIDVDSKYYKDLNHFLKKDEVLEKHIEMKDEAEKKHKEELKKADEKKQKELDKIEKKRIKELEKKEKEKKKNEKVLIVTNDDISDSITSNL